MESEHRSNFLLQTRRKETKDGVRVIELNTSYVRRMEIWFWSIPDLGQIAYNSKI